MDQTHQREAAIFDAAMELPPEQRAAHLDHACGGDAALRQRIESLLKACESSCDFLDSPADPGAAEATNVLPPSFEKVGDRIGRYKLLQQIGEGGCGVVYMAEQEEPVSRRVALKVIKLGLDTKSVIARFEAERQALALMDHANIAKVLDAGATETGRPYFVMELVRGLKITEYCDEARLSTNARLDLFIQVCQAIQHAHQKGIIHRDIKPSNILVTINDGVPVPKVIDFGIAKATSGQKLTNKTVFTAFEQFIGTPAYMSPEQAVLTSLDIDTRSDIYALGVLLYELLTGETPFDAKELLAIGLDEMRRTIREQEPQRPSTRLSTLSGQELSTTAQRRGLDAPKLASELRGDLDWIVMKCLEKDRARRYETANGLAADIQRHLKNEPVVASPPSNLYRLRKMVRRNKLAFSAAAAIAAALVAGVIVSLWQAQRARHAERASKSEKDTTEAVLNFFRDNVLAAGRPEGREGGLGTDVKLRQAIDAAESQITKTFQDRPLVEAAIRKTIGETYLYLGEPRLAMPQLDRALTLRREGLGVANEHTVGTMDRLRQAYSEAGFPFEFLPFYQEAFKLAKTKLALKPDAMVSIMNSLAMAYQDAGKLDQALPLYEQTLKLAKTRLGPDKLDTFKLMINVAHAYRSAGRLDQAFSLYEEFLKLLKANKGAEDPITLDGMYHVAFGYAAAENFNRALPLYEETLKLRQKTLGRQNHDTLATMNSLAAAYASAGKFDLALPLYKETLNLRTATLGLDHPDTLRTMSELVFEYLRAKKPEQAVPLGEQALDLSKTKRGLEHPGTLQIMHNLALAYRESGDFDKAIVLSQETLKLRTAKFGASDQNRLNTLAELITTYQGAGKPEQGIAIGEEALGTIECGPCQAKLMNLLARAYETSGNLDKAIALYQQILGLEKIKSGFTQRTRFSVVSALFNIYRNTSKFAEAEALLREELNRLKAPAIENREEDVLWQLAWVQRELAELLRRRNSLAEARSLAKQAIELHNKHPDWQREERMHAWWVLVPLLRDLGDYSALEAVARDYLPILRKQFSVDDPEVGQLTASLAVVLLNADKFAAAEPLARESLAIREKIEPNSWPTFNSRSMLGGCLLGQKKYDEAEPLLLAAGEGLMLRKNSIPRSARMRVNEALQRLIELYEKTGRADRAAEWKQKLAEIELVEPLRIRADSLARRGQFAEAAADLSRVCEVTPEDPELWHQLAALLVGSGQIDVYREHCRKSLERFGKTGDPLTAERLAKDSLILPNSGADLGLVDELADLAGAFDKHWATPWFRVVKGLSEYRQGRFTGAVEWLKKALTTAGAGEREVEAYAVLAMAHYQLKQNAEAQAAFAKGAEIEHTKLQKLANGDIPGNWLDWIMAHALMREAKALIEANSQISAAVHE